VNSPALGRKYFIMKFGNVSLVGLLILLVFGASVAARAQSKPVMVHYMPWFQPSYSLAADKMLPCPAEPGLQGLPQPS
jgi:hypothetical protein